MHVIQARPLNRRQKNLELCEDENCIRDPTYYVDDVPYCTRHAKEAAFTLALEAGK